jgi:hypothetical protein
MTCVLTTGRSLGCRDSVGGIKAIYVTELANKATLTSATEGLISAFTLSTGKQFWTIALNKEVGEFEEKIIPSVENGTRFYETDLKLSLQKGDVATRNLLKLLVQNQCMIIILDRNGNYWLMGETNGADLDPSSFKSGKAMGDMNGYEVAFNAKEENPMQQVTASLMAVLLAPAV